MKRIFIVPVLAMLLFACSKDKFETVPRVRIDSITPDQAVIGNIIQVNATVTDKEGDVQDSVLVVKKTYNGATELRVDTVRISLKGLGYPAKDKIDLRLQISYGQIPPGYMTQDPEYDFDRDYTVGLVVTDNAGHRSEYVESKRIVLKRYIR